MQQLRGRGCYGDDVIGIPHSLECTVENKNCVRERTERKSEGEQEGEEEGGEEEVGEEEEGEEEGGEEEVREEGSNSSLRTS